VVAPETRTIALPSLLTLALALAACGTDRSPRLQWGLGVQTFDAAALGLGTADAPDPWIAGIQPATRLKVPTYDGSGQLVHPDVLLESTADGSRAVMAITPYPFTNDRFENPSLVETRDGMQFAPFPGAESPLVPAPPIDHNDDPDLRLDPASGDHELLYLETLRPDRQTLVALRSRDLVHWTRRDAIVYDLAHGAPFIVSPAAIVGDDGATHLFYVDNLAMTTAITTLVSADGMTWDPATASRVAIDLGGVTAWHIDVIRGAHGYGMLISGFDAEFAHQNLYLATSPDLVTWTFRPAPLLAHTDPELDVATLYRSTGLVSGNTLVVWYSMQHE
jgi:hypothetical protein